MNVVLVKKTSDGSERAFPLRVPKTVIGRETLCHIRIALPSVADRHCEIHVEKDRLHLRDLRSDIGTFVNGRPVKTATLSHKDELSIGPVTFVVRVEQASVTPEPKAPSQSVEIVSSAIDPSEASDAAASATKRRGAGA